MSPDRGQCVVVGMSGGVDSSVAALLLKEQGFRVIGVTMALLPEESSDTVSEHGGCCGLSAAEDAAAVCRVIGIPHYVMNFRKEFREKVIDYFADEYLRGRTPNPCIACNRYIKWEAFLSRAQQIGADRIATGHYARIEVLPNGRLTVRTADHPEKDQSYALYGLSQDMLAKTYFPCGMYPKPEIRAIAERAHLPVAQKKDSQEVCFIPDDDHASFIARYTGKTVPKGPFVLSDGTVIGTHEGITHYTIGQRRGLGLAMGHHVYVTQIRPETNEVVIGENADLFSDTVYVRDVNYMGIETLTAPRRVIGRIRYNHRGAPGMLYPDRDGVRCVFDEPQRAATPGQAAVFYENGGILCGGTII